jgi:hypothetical protein
LRGGDHRGRTRVARLPRGSVVRIAPVLVMGAATTLVIVTVTRGVGRLDEMQQKIQLEALAFAFAGTGVLASSYGFLVGAGHPTSTGARSCGPRWWRCGRSAR